MLAGELRLGLGWGLGAQHGDPYSMGTPQAGGGSCSPGLSLRCITALFVGPGPLGPRTHPFLRRL